MIEFLKNNSLLVLLIVGAAFTFWRLLTQRRLLRINWVAALSLSILHTLIGVACVKVFAVLETLDFSQVGATSLFGAVFFLPLVYFAAGKLFKRKLAAVFDVFTPCVIFTLLCARINCIISGCCLGVYINGASGLRYPTREMEVLFYVVLLGYLFWKERKGRLPGWQYPFYMAAYGVFRFVTEFFRDSRSDGLFHISHLWAAISVIVGYAIYAELKAQGTAAKKSQKTHR